MNHYTDCLYWRTQSNELPNNSNAIMRKTDWLILKADAPFGMKLWWAMQMRDVSCRKLGKMVGVSGGTVQHWCECQSYASCTKLFEVAEVLNVNVAWLISV